MSTRERVLDLIEYVKAGRIVDAIQEFYADDVIMQENRRTDRALARLSRDVPATLVHRAGASTKREPFERTVMYEEGLGMRD